MNIIPMLMLSCLMVVFNTNSTFIKKAICLSPLSLAGSEGWRKGGQHNRHPLSTSPVRLAGVSDVGIPTPHCVRGCCHLAVGQRQAACPVPCALAWGCEQVSGRRPGLAKPSAAGFPTTLGAAINNQGNPCYLGRLWERRERTDSC